MMGDDRAPLMRRDRRSARVRRLLAALAAAALGAGVGWLLTAALLKGDDAGASGDSSSNASGVAADAHRLAEQAAFKAWRAQNRAQNLERYKGGFKTANTSLANTGAKAGGAMQPKQQAQQQAQRVTSPPPPKPSAKPPPPKNEVSKDGGYKYPK